MAINEETRMHGAAVLVLFEELGKALPEINFTLKTGASRNCYILEAIRPSVLGKGKRLAIGLYIKTSQKRRGPWRYNYLKEHQDEILDLKQKFGETFNIFVNGIFELQIPIITDDAILPVPIKPNFIINTISTKIKTLGKKKAP
mgnify:CR=1 FL=1